MTLSSLHKWRAVRLARIDQCLAAHPDVAGSSTDPSVTREWTRALVLLLASEFQGFCRDLHDDVADTISHGVAGTDERFLKRIRFGLTVNRGLNRRSADVQTLDQDFLRLGTKLSAALSEQYPAAAAAWLDGLRHLHRARNGIIHDDDKSLDKAEQAGWVLQIGTARRWRNLVDEMATAMAYLVDTDMANLFSMKQNQKGEADGVRTGQPGDQKLGGVSDTGHPGASVLGRRHG